MVMQFQAKWIRPVEDTGDICPEFFKYFEITKKIKKAELKITALGIYEGRLNDKRISNYVLAPGWTAYKKRIQFQCYDITEQLQTINELSVIVGKGWMRSPMPGWLETKEKHIRMQQSSGMICEVHLLYQDGQREIIGSDKSWCCQESQVRFSEIYDGEVYDATFHAEKSIPVECFEGPTNLLVSQEGEEIREMERISVKEIIYTPKGETVIDFGQNITGYVEFTVNAKLGDKIRIQHGEILDADGNFYNDNYRSAKAEIIYICKEGKQTWHPKLTFFGFRYLKLCSFPGEISVKQFNGIVVYSNVRHTGKIHCSNSQLNQLFSNALWGQKGNFLDIPTDCPQRDERLGWTGDAQVFIKAATYNYDVEKFFVKWLHDLAAEQRDSGAVGQVIPDYLEDSQPSAAWGDAAVICPWQIYLTYGNKKVLTDQFHSMKKWVDYITATTTVPFLWIGGNHFGDWLGLDAPQGSYKGSSREDFIASAYYSYSVSLLIKAGKALERDMSAYEEMHKQIIVEFRKCYPDYYTQTEYVLAIWFGLATDPKKSADELAKLVLSGGGKLQTGFVGTPYILHVLSAYGHTELAYSLLLRTEYPSWLYPVSKGATTIWEHWDGIMQDNTLWDANMNSFNHYSYGAVLDWVYEEAAGIKPVENAPGFAKVYICPKADPRLDWLEGSIETRKGVVRSKWKWIDQVVCYEIETPVPATIVIEEVEQKVQPGVYIFWGHKLKS